jgi:hypothetical protein
MTKPKYTHITNEQDDASPLVDRYFLYIDILGFTNLVMTSPQRVEDLYEVISSLNAHHHESFGTIVFSDTILVYPKFKRGVEKQADTYFIMYLCEFVKDLLYRLRNKDIHFRAVITKGKFTHYLLNSIPCFYGPALVDAYNSEKKIKAVGLFMDRRCTSRSTVFQTKQFDDRYDFVYLLQSLEVFEPHGMQPFPFPNASIFADMDDPSYLAQDALILSNLARNRSLPGPSVSQKYVNTWDLLMVRYPTILQKLEAANFNPSVFCPGLDWTEYINRARQDDYV